MPKKKPLVEDARNGLDALRNHVFQQMRPDPPSYREQFRSLARKRVERMRRVAPNAADPKSRPDH